MKKKNEKGGGVLIILQIWEWSVISPNQGVASLVSPKEEGVSVIYPKNKYIQPDLKKKISKQNQKLSSCENITKTKSKIYINIYIYKNPNQM